MNAQRNFDDLLERHKAATIERKAEEERKLLEAEKNKVVQLTMWPEAIRGVPNSALRGSLFAAVHGNDCRYMERELLHDDDKLKIRYTGKQLSQSDLDVWEQALHLARAQCLGNEVYFTAHGFLKALGRRTGRSGHEWLKDVFARLCGCCVEITHEGCTYGGNLLDFERKETEGRYKLTINPKMARLYTAGWTGIKNEDRRRIGSKKPLALWLHGYISSHAKIYPTNVETYHRLSGSENKEMRGFRRRLREALDSLVKVELIRGFEFRGDLVHIENIPSRSQQKHLEGPK